MTKTIQLGAPSLTGKDANDLIASNFADANFPLDVLITNHMPRDVVFPDVNGLFLRHCANKEGSSAVVTIAEAGQLQRLASGVEQVAELNKYAIAITVSTDVTGADPVDEEAETERLAQEEAEAKKLADEKELADLLAAEQAEKEAAEKLALEEAEKLAAEQLAKEQAEAAALEAKNSKPKK